MKKFTCPGLQNWTGSFGLLVLGVVALLMVTTNISRAQTNFASAEVLSGDFGIVTNENIGVTPDIGAPNIDGFAPNAPLWYQWTAPQDGVVSLDTIGSMDGFAFDPTNIFFFGSLDTVLGVYTGSSLSTLTQVAANDDLFPVNDSTASENAFGLQNGYLTQVTESGNADTLQLEQQSGVGFLGGDAGGAINSFIQPFYGPSGLRFNAVGGQTYYFAVDSKSASASSSPISLASGTGLISLSWAYQPSGVFRFASEDVDALSGMLLYQTAQTESQPIDGLDNSGESTVLTYYDYNAPGALVTVTRVAGSTGRCEVNYTTVDGTNLELGTNDAPAFGGVDYTPVSGTLVFDDFEMSKTILIPILYDFGTPGDQTNRVFAVQLSNPQLDPAESSSVSQPRVDPTFDAAMVRIMNANADPYGPDLVEEIETNPPAMGSTNAPMVVTNIVNALFPTNVVFNFEKAHYRVPADVNSTNVSPWLQVTLWVERFGTNNAATTLNYRVNNFLGSDQESAEEQNIFFPLQPGSDFAVPNPPTIGTIRGDTDGSTNSDFVMTEGTISFPSSGPAAEFQPITFTIPTNTLTKFNKDFKVQIYQEVTVNGVTFPQLVGMVNEATVTILFDDQVPPAGSVDEFYNADFNDQMALYASQVPVTSPPDNANPGVGISGEVYSMLMLTNDEALVGGDFNSYNGTALSRMALVNTNGQLDTSFNTGAGADAAVNAVAADGNQYFVGGSFSSFNSKSVGQGGGIVRLNADGSTDGSFSPGLGPDGPVRAVAVLPNGEVLIGGDFTHINGQVCNYIALLNTSGGLDTSFSPSNNITGPVYALLLQGGRVLVGGNFSVTGETYQDIARLHLNGSVDTTFNPGTGADNVVHTLARQPTGQILVGGEFTHFDGAALNRLAQLNNDGSLDTTNFFIGTGADNTVFCINDVTSYVEDTNDVIIATNTAIYVGGAFDSIDGTHRLGFARLYPNGTVDTTFMDTAYNQFAGLKRIYSYDTPAVFATAMETNGNVLIGGSFNQVGGGQANTNVWNTLDDEEGIFPESFDDSNLWVEPKTRDGVRNRSGLASLIGGATPGPGNIGFSSSSYSANKSQSSIPNVSLVRTNGTLGPVSVNFSVQSGTAASGRDFTYFSAPPIDWVASQFITHRTRERSDGLFGESGALIDPDGLNLTLADSVVNDVSIASVNIIDNKNTSGNLDAQFQLANPSLSDTFYLGGEEIPVGTALGVSAAPLTLVDDTSAPGTFGFSSPSYVATNLSAAISVVRSNGVFGVVTMKYATENGTALAGTDYVGITNQNLVFSSSQTSNAFNVTIKNDGYITNVEKTVKLSLYDLETSSGAQFGISNAVLRIINPNFQGFVTLGATNFIGTISSGVLNFAVNRISGSLGSLAVQYATTNGSAISGRDYVGATNTLTWNSGDVSPRIVSIPLINPDAVGGNKQFGVTLSNPMLNSTSSPALLTGEITNATLVISNDSSYGSIQFSAPSYTVSENGGYATITVVRTGGYVGTVSVNYATANGSNTTSGVNYTATSGVLVLGPDQSAASFTVPVINDGVVDPANFFFNVTLSNPTNATLGSL
ncbi:MAG: Calx-beta domain-containing protein, partial [Verrucomicrobiota bacterium]